MADLVGPIQHKRGTTSQWASSNIPLRDGEIGIDTTLRRIKIGDGSTLFAGLPWNSMSQADVARLEAAAIALEGATAPTDAAMTSVQGNPNSAFAQAQKATYAPILDGGETVSRRFDHLVSARTFGAVGDGTTDDTAALQAFFDYIVANKRNGFLPRANYRITSTLIIRSGPGWTLTGNGNRGTLITQDTDNVPVIQLGHEVGTQFHHFRIADLWVTYKNAQPAANTNASGFYIYDMIWQGRIERVGFKRGFYGIKVRPGTGNPWGQTWDDLHFGDGLTGGAIDWTGGVNQTPNNVWGRFYVEIGAMVGPIFANVRGYDWIWHSTEFIQAATDLPKLITFADGTHVEMGAFKVENSPLTTAKQLIEVAGNSKITIGHIFWTGGGLGIPAVSSGAVYLFSVGSSGAGDSLVEVGEVTMQLTADYLSQPLYLFRRGNTDVQMRVRRLRLKNGWKAINFDASPVGAVADSLWVDEWVNDRMVAKGDADVTIALGNPNIMRFATAFSAVRTITLPTDKTNIHSGMYYDLIFDGAINGSNTAVIKAGTTTLRTQTTDKVRMRFTWQVDSSASAGWKLTAYATLP